MAADRVVLTNGDVLTGEVVTQTEAQVVLDHPVLGEMPIKRERIETLTLEQAEDKQAEQPKPDPPAPEPEPKPEPEEDAKPPKDPAAVEEQARQAAEANKTAFDRLLEDWDNRLTLGLNGATGNTDQQNYYAKFDTRHQDGRHRWIYNSQWYYTQTNGNQTRNQFRANLTKDWLKKDSPWFFFLKGNYEYDANRSWQNRTSGFGGGGYTLAKTDDLELNTRIGFGGTYEYGSINEFTPEALFGASVIKWNLTDRAAIQGDTTYYPSLEDSGAFRIQSGLEWTYKLDLARGLSLKLGLENEYDSHTPSDTNNNDFKYFGAVVFDF